MEFFLNIISNPEVEAKNFKLRKTKQGPLKTLREVLTPYETMK